MKKRLRPRRKKEMQKQHEGGLRNIQIRLSPQLNDISRARRASDPNAVIPPPVRRKDRPSKPNGLTKQTYSATVNFPETGETRKWHVVAYFSVWYISFTKIHKN